MFRQGAIAPSSPPLAPPVNRGSSSHWNMPVGFRSSIKVETNYLKGKERLEGNHTYFNLVNLVIISIDLAHMIGKQVGNMGI